MKEGERKKKEEKERESDGRLETGLEQEKMEEKENDTRAFHTCLEKGLEKMVLWSLNHFRKENLFCSLLRKEKM